VHSILFLSNLGSVVRLDGRHGGGAGGAVAAAASDDGRAAAGTGAGQSDAGSGRHPDDVGRRGAEEDAQEEQERHILRPSHLGGHGRRPAGAIVLRPQSHLAARPTLRLPPAKPGKHSRTANQITSHQPHLKTTLIKPRKPSKTQSNMITV